MTDNELTAKVGRLLFGQVAKEVSPGVRRYVIQLYPGKPWEEQAVFGDNSEEGIGRVLESRLHGYATDSRWVGPIIEAAATKGILLRVETDEDGNCTASWTNGPNQCFDRYRIAASLPRAVCEAVVAAVRP